MAKLNGGRELEKHAVHHVDECSPVAAREREQRLGWDFEGAHSAVRAVELANQSSGGRQIGCSREIHGFLP